MEKNLLAAIIGAVSAYIQQESVSRASEENVSSTWWLRGQRELMTSRINTRGVSRTNWVKGTWRRSRRDEFMGARSRWKIRKFPGREEVSAK
jgi:hypothetical protein